MKKSLIVALIVTLVFVFTLTPAQAKEKVYEFNFSNITPAAHPYYSKIMEPWAREIEKRANGKVKITLYPAGTLVQGNVMYSGIKDGITDIGTSSFGWEVGIHPLFEGVAYAPGFPNAMASCRIVNQLYEKFKPKELADTHVLFLMAATPMHLWSKKPVRKMEDLKGMEIRAAGGTGKLIKLLGAVPVSATQGEVYEMLSKGIVKGSVSSLDVLKGFRQAEVVSSVTLAYFHTAPFFTCMNRDKWNSLPPDIQKIFTEVSQEFISIAGNAWDKGGEEGLQYAKAEGLEIITLPPKEKARWHAKYKPLQDQYIKEMAAKGLPGKEFMDDLLRLIAESQSK